MSESEGKLDWISFALSLFAHPLILIMVIWVADFQSEGYKISKIFDQHVPRKLLDFVNRQSREVVNTKYVVQKSDFIF